MNEKRSSMAGQVTKFAGAASQSSGTASKRPILQAGIAECFLQLTATPRTGSKLVYRPAILGQASMHFVRATNNVDHWEDVSLLVPLPSEPADLPDAFWEGAAEVPDGVLELASTPESDFQFMNISPTIVSVKNFKAWDKELKDHLFRNHQVTIFSSKALKRTSRPGQPEDEARIELSHAAREARDAAVGKLKQKMDEKLKSLQAKIAAAEQKVAKEKAEEKTRWMNSMLNVGTSILGAVLGNKLASKTNITKMASAARTIGQATGARGDVAIAEQTLQEILEAKEALEKECEAEIERISDEFSAENLELEPIEIPARKTIHGSKHWFWLGCPGKLTPPVSLVRWSRTCPKPSYVGLDGRFEFRI